MKILLLGKNGQVGWELRRTLVTLGEIVALDQEDLDLTDFAAIRRTVREIKPNLIVNAAAYTAVDKAEEEQEPAMAVNGIAPGILAEEAKKIDTALVHYSTDYIFDGTKMTPYRENDEPNPLNVYGKTKLAGEQAIHAVGGACLILRTSWIYGRRGKNFLRTILRLSREREELNVVNDQIGTPTWSRMIAEVTGQIISRGVANIYGYMLEQSGVYHLTASGSTTWYGFAKAVLEKDPKREEQVYKVLLPVMTREYPTPAKRPRYSMLENEKLKRVLGLIMPEWQKQLELTLID